MLTAGVRPRFFVAISFVAATLALCAGVFAQGSLESRIRGALDKARLGKASVGICVVDASTGRELVSISSEGQSGESLIPASNLKLLTTGAALVTVGPEFEFRTQFVVAGDQVFIEGAGDPALADPELLARMKTSVEQFLDRLADSIAGAGSAEIREVVLDDRIFDREFVHPMWPVDQLNRAYCAPVQGVNFHANILRVFPQPGSRAGDPPSVRTEPAAAWIEFDRQRARTVREGSTQVWIEHGSNTFRYGLHGSVRNAPTEPVSVSVKDPAAVFARLLADRIGTRLKCPSPTVRLAAADEPVGSSRSGAVVAAIVRTPISVVLERCNVDSDNLYAESLLKLTGHEVTHQPGSWANGAAVVRMIVKDRIGASHAASLTVSDGSGLSRANRVTPQLLAHWLANMASDERVGDAYVRSLPIAKEEGTVKNRFKGKKLANEVRAKSGYIRQVRSLSGLVTAAGESDSLVPGQEPPRRLAFSILVNDIPAGADQRAKELHENVVEVLDGYLTERARVTASAGVR
jgi:D-alanyl-D-alanine carboxypeptidase/D-alanyl-D-alanine-endopeptidase (penicillin-binding protein 4)